MAGLQTENMQFRPLQEAVGVLELATGVFGVRTWDLEGLPKIPNWWVLGAFGGSGDAFSWSRKAKFPHVGT